MAQLPTSWLSVLEVHVTVANCALLAIGVQPHLSKSISTRLPHVPGVFVVPGLQTANLRVPVE